MGIFLTVKIRNYLSIWVRTEMKWGMAATKQKIFSLYVCQLITTLQRRFWKDKASCINLAVIQAGKTNLQGMALSSCCSFLRKLTLDIWAQFRKCLIFFPFPALHKRILNSIQYLTFKRHCECCRQFRVITDNQKNIFIYVHIYDCRSGPFSCLLACAICMGGGVFGLTEDAAHFNVLRKIHQSSLQNKSCIPTCSFQWKWRNPHKNRSLMKCLSSLACHSNYHWFRILSWYTTINCSYSAQSKVYLRFHKLHQFMDERFS